MSKDFTWKSQLNGTTATVGDNESPNYCGKDEADILEELECHFNRQREAIDAFVQRMKDLEDEIDHLENIADGDCPENRKLALEDDKRKLRSILGESELSANAELLEFVQKQMSRVVDADGPRDLQVLKILRDERRTQ